MERSRTYTGEREVIDESGFPEFVDPGFYLGGDLDIRRDDGGFWVVMRPDFEGDFGGFLAYRVNNLFVDGNRVDSSEFLDVMRQFEPVKDEMCGEVVMAEKPEKTADIDIPFETWVRLNRVEIVEITVENWYGIRILEMKLERYDDGIELVEEGVISPLPS